MSETTKARQIDKTGWGPGEWQNEPDRADWIHAGFACMALRHDEHGYWCGYVGVPNGHPRYGVDDAGDLDGHGGVNYAARCSGDICHVPAPGMPDDVWWFGFDCGHCFDLSPGMRARMAEYAANARERGAPSAFELNAVDRMEVYRALPYVREVVNGLAEQLRAMA